MVSSVAALSGFPTCSVTELAPVSVTVPRLAKSPSGSKLQAPSAWMMKMPPEAGSTVTEPPAGTALAPPSSTERTRMLSPSMSVAPDQAGPRYALSAPRWHRCAARRWRRRPRSASLVVIGGGRVGGHYGRIVGAGDGDGEGADIGGFVDILDGVGHRGGAGFADAQVVKAGARVKNSRRRWRWMVKLPPWLPSVATCPDCWRTACPPPCRRR